MNNSLTKDKIEYIVMFISEFSRRHHLPGQDANNYLKKYNAIDLIERCYDVMHTQSFNDMVTDMTAYCHRRGGVLQ